jgi:hypothetical protein
VLSGLIPSPTELEHLARERQSLGFDPLTQPESLDASNDNDRRSAKRCLRAVIGNDPERERLCWVATPLDELKARGARNGLQRFLEDAAAVAKRLF